MWESIRVWILVGLAALMVVTGCSRSPEAKKAQHLE
jgi:hypothetical protein